jgi:conjugative transfer region lipoprotein (TIGR03751 family)
VRHWTNFVVLLCGVLVLNGCATRVDSLIPKGGEKITDIYDRHMKEVRAGAGPQSSPTSGSSSRPITTEGLDTRDRDTYMHTSANEVDARFARLPNPDLVMYVAPHLTARGQPVPGYTTVFPMYERVEYALPGEVRGVKAPAALTTASTSRVTPSAAVKERAPQMMPSSLDAATAGAR